MAIVLRDEFEDGKLGTADLNPYSSPIGGWPSYSVSVLKKGGHSMRINGTPGPQAVVYTAGVGAGKRTLVGSLYVYMDTPFAGTTTVWSTFTDPNNRSIGFFCETVSGSQYWQSYTADTNLTSYVQYNGTNAPITLDRWYRIDFKFNTSVNPWTVDFMVDGVPQAQGTRAFAAEDLKQHDVGELDAVTSDYYIDSVWLDDSLARYPIGEHIASVGEIPARNVVQGSSLVAGNW